MNHSVSKEDVLSTHDVKYTGDTSRNWIRLYYNYISKEVTRFTCILTSQGVVFIKTFVILKKPQ